MTEAEERLIKAALALESIFVEFRFDSDNNIKAGSDFINACIVVRAEREEQHPREIESLKALAEWKQRAERAEESLKHLDAIAQGF